jgi:hypothetical protein
MAARRKVFVALRDLIAGSKHQNAAGLYDHCQWHHNTM